MQVHYWQRGRIGDFVLTTPMILGHESAGTITDVGAAVKHLKVGQRVAIEPGVPCRRCDYCRSGAYNLCPDTVFAATPPWDGTLAKYYTVASDYVYPIPDHMTMEEGAMVEPTAVAVQITKVAELRAGHTVVVFGCGMVHPSTADVRSWPLTGDLQAQLACFARLWQKLTELRE